MVLVKFIPVLLLLTACQSITLTASCNQGDVACQRNQNAQTLALIGKEEAAVKLMCQDPYVRDTLGEDCTGW